MSVEAPAPRHIRLTSHAGGHGALPIHWHAATPGERGPVVGTTTGRSHRNVIGTHSGSYSVYRALAVAAGALSRQHKADLTNTAPTDEIGPYPQWSEPGRIVSLDPWGAVVSQVFAAELAAGYDIRPTIAITKAHVVLPEVIDALRKGRLQADGRILTEGGAAMVTKAAIEPVWWLPGVADRFGCTEADLRRVLFEETGGMYPELVTRSDLEVFLPPIGGQTVYIFGNPRDLADPEVELTARVHDECNGSDVFGSDICTCRPYLRMPSRSASRAPSAAAWDWCPTRARKDARSARSPSSWSTTPASARWAATPPTSISRAPNAWPASRTCGSRS
jgi:GTP cyclohydrolase II